MKEYDNQIFLPDLLLVNSRLENDPAGKQGEIGFIVAIIFNNDEFYLGFDDDEVGLYSADALLALKQPAQIYETLRQDAQLLSVDDFRELKNIARLLGHATEKHNRVAMELVRNNPNLQDHATVSLDVLIGLVQSRQPGR